MAFSYRTSVEEGLNRLTSEEQSRVSAPFIQNLSSKERKNHEFFSFHMPEEGKRRLSLRGIYLSPHSFFPHSHPICKTLENNILYNILPSKLDNSFYFIGIKNSKVNFIKGRGNKLDMIQVINRVVTSQDRYRYSNELTVQSVKTPLGLAHHNSGLAKLKLENLLPSMVSKKEPKFFIHDELHYWALEDIRAFLKTTRPSVLLATVVFPPELLIGAKKSMNPWCYEFEVEGKLLSFFPDGVRSEGYCQPLSSGDLLRANSIDLLDGSHYCVDLVYSSFAHHLFCFTPGGPLKQIKRHFSDFSAVSIDHLSGLTSHRNNCYPVTYELVSKMYLYLRTLKKPDPQSSMAKLRQLVERPTSDEIKFCEELSQLIIDSDSVNLIFCESIITKMKSFFVSLMPGPFRKFFSIYKERALSVFIENLKPLEFSISLEPSEILQSLDHILLNLWSSWDGDTPLDHIICTVIQKGRDPQPYDNPGLNCRREPFLTQFDGIVLRSLIKIFLPAFSHEGMLCVSEAELRGVILCRCIKSLGLQASIIGPDFKCSFGLELLRERRTLFKERRTLFNVGHIIWFFSSRRAYTKFLLPKLYNHAHINESRKFFSQCMDTIASGVGSSLLKSYLDVPVICRSPSAVKILPLTGECDLSLPMGFDMITPLVPSIRDAVKKQEEPIVLLPDTSALEESFSVVVQDKTFQSVVEDYIKVSAVDAKHFNSSIDSISASFDNANLEKNSFKGRDALFHARCKCIQYGHDKVSYNWNKWNPILSSFLEGDENYYNSCLVQKYSKDAILNFHADDERCYGDDPILTVNLTGHAELRIIKKHVKQRRDGLVDSLTGEVAVFLLTPGSCFSFPSGFQRLFKHSVKSLSDDRISLTYRNQIKTVKGDKIRHVCPEGAEFEVVNKCTITPFPGAMIENFNVFPVPGDGNCFWHSMAILVGLKTDMLLERLAKEVTREGLNERSAIYRQVIGDEWADRDGITFFCSKQMVSLTILNDNPELNHLIVPNHASSPLHFFVYLSNDHYSPCIPKNGCVLKALAEALGRRESDILAVLGRPENGDVMCDLIEGEGLSLELLEKCFCIFDVAASISTESGTFDLNQQGKLRFFFELNDNHLMLIKQKTRSASKVLPTISGLSGLGGGNIDLIESMGSLIPYSPNLERANLLHNCFIDGLTGKILDSSFSLQSPFISEFKQQDGGVNLTVILGTFGSGKSTLFSKMVKMRGRKELNFISPRKALAEQVKKELSILGGGNNQAPKSLHKPNLPRGIKIRTFERAIKERASLNGSVVVIDEIQLYPPGYLDLLVGVTSGCKFVLLGDPCQSDYHSAEDHSILGSMCSDIDDVLNDRAYNYNICSRRFQAPLFLNRLPCRFHEGSIRKDGDDDFDVLNSMSELADIDEKCYDCILVSSFAEKTVVWAYLGRHVKCLTFGESTGLTFDSGVVVLSEESVLCSEKRWITALSRFRKHIIFLNLMDVGLDDVNQRFHDRVLSDFLTSKSSEKRILSMLPGKPKLKMDFGEKVGKDEGVKELKLAGDPWLKPSIFLGQSADVGEEVEVENFVDNVIFQTHLPLSSLETIRSRWVHKLKDREIREMRIGSEISCQFPEDHSKNGGVHLTNAAERYEAIYPRHKGSDSVTFLMAVKKRLKFSNPAKESAKYRRAKPFGQMMLMEFLKKVKLTRERNSVMMESSVADFEEKKTSKPGATIENHSGRSCRDWANDVALIFMKSQHCTKFDNRFRDAKAGQTLACFQHSVLCRFAPYMRYIEKKVFEVLPKNFYIHSGKNLESLDEWVLGANFRGTCTESDYEAFDASQDHYIMAFEVELMKYLGLPNDLIEDYIYIKTHLGSKLGSFAIMRFTGEASTFLFNTLANMIFTFMRYDLNGKEYICFAGDDMCAKGALKLSKRYSEFLDKLNLKAKVSFTPNPTFCGWNLCAKGIFKKPQLVLERLCIARETGNLHNCLDSYAIEVSFAYSMGEDLQAFLDDEGLEAHYQAVRFIVTHKKLLKSKIVDLFSSV